MVCEAADPFASNEDQSVSICVYPRSSAVSLPCVSSAGVAVDEILRSAKKNQKTFFSCACTASPAMAPIVAAAQE